MTEDRVEGFKALEALTALEPLAERLQAACLGRGVWVATAESCTGGLVAHAITQVAGSSGYFRGSIVAYANEAKTDVLGVDGALIEAHGAVSAQVARAMATAARARFGTEYAVSTTGVAGPGGGSDEKPVGLVYLHVSAPWGPLTREMRWGGARVDVRQRAAVAALHLMREHLEGSGTAP